MAPLPRKKITAKNWPIHTYTYTYICGLFCIFLLTACQTTQNTQPQGPTFAAVPKVGTQTNTPKKPLPDYFLIEPTHLTKGHIFLRRSVTQTALKPIAPKPIEATTLQKNTNATPLPHATKGAKAKVKNVANADTSLSKAAIHTAENTPKKAPIKPIKTPRTTVQHTWEDIRIAQVSVHTENQPFMDLVENAVKSTVKHAGPWRVQWKIKRENRNLLHERFSLNTETNFDKFMTSLALFILNHRGIELNFQLFDSERILVISDVFAS